MAMPRRLTDEDAAELTEALKSPLAGDLCEVCALPEDLQNLLLDRADDIAEIGRLRILVDRAEIAIGLYQKALLRRA